MQMIDEDSRDMEASFRSQTSLMPDMYLEKGGNIGEDTDRSNSVWTNNTKMAKEPVDQDLLNSQI